MEEMKKQAQELIEQTYNSGFSEGYENGVNAGYNTGCADGYKKGIKEGCSNAEKVYHEQTKKDTQSFIKQGHDEAWEAVRKISKTESYKLNDIFGEGWFWDIFNKFSASEVIEKLHKYEKKQEEDKIKVGDEVCIYGEIIGIVTHISEIEGFSILWKDGSAGKRKNISDFKKTGRTFPEIVEVLKKLKEDKE